MTPLVLISHWMFCGISWCMKNWKLINVM